MKKITGLVAFLLLVTTLYSAEKQKIIYDCDLGGDIDDAFALALILTSPEFEVLGLVMDPLQSLELRFRHQVHKSRTLSRNDTCGELRNLKIIND